MTRYFGTISLMCLISACTFSVGESPTAEAEDALPNLSEQSVDGNQATPTSAGDPNHDSQSIVYTGTSYSRVGRFDTRDPNFVRYNYQLSKLGISFTGTSLSVRLADTGSDGFDLLVDGVRYVAYPGQGIEGCRPIPNAGPMGFDANNNWGACLSMTPTANPNTFLLVKNLEPALHTAWFIKRTEFDRGDDNGGTGAPHTGTVSVYNFVIDANAIFAKPPSPKARRILFSGDSGYTGYTVARLLTRQQSNSCLYTVATQDAFMGVAEYTAQMCDADAVNIACTGEAVYDSVYDRNPNHNLPFTFEQALGNDTSLSFDFATDPIDVVVLVAGGDDLWGASGQGAFRDPQAFHAAYTNWLTNIRKHYPKALIVAAVTQAAQGNDFITLRDAYASAIAERNAAGDFNIEPFNYFINDPNGWTSYSDVANQGGYGYSCVGHISAGGGYWLAERLAAFIRLKMKW